MLVAVGGPFIVTWVSITALILILSARRLLMSALGPAMTVADVLVFVSFLLPSIVVITLPIANFAAQLFGLGRLVADGALLSLEMAGVSPLRIARIPFLLALLSSIMGIVVAHFVAPYAARSLHGRLSEVVMRNLSVGLESERFITVLPDLVVKAEPLGQNHVCNLVVHDGRNTERPIVFTASTGNMEPKGHQLSFGLKSGSVSILGESPVHIRFNQAAVIFDMSNYVHSRTRSLGRLPQMSSVELLQNLEDDTLVQRMRRDFWRRTAEPLSAITFFLVAIVILGRRDQKRWLLVACLGLLTILSFYILSRVADAAINMGAEPILVFLPNVVLTVIAITFQFNRGQRSKVCSKLRRRCLSPGGSH